MPATWVTRSFVRVCIAALVLFLGSAPRPASSAPLPGSVPQTPRPDFVKDIAPIFSRNCYECHGPEKQKGGLRLDQKVAAFKGGDTGPLLVPGKARDSLLIQAVEGGKPDLAQMPKKRDPLTPEQIALLRAWVDQGATWPDLTPLATAKNWRKHWAFHAPSTPALPG